MHLLSFGVSRGLDLEELCRTIGCPPTQITDPLRMVPFDVSLRLWRLLIERLSDINIAVALTAGARFDGLGPSWMFMKHLRNSLEVLEAVARLSPYGDTACISEPISLVHVGDVVELRWPASLKFGIPERTETLNLLTLSILQDLTGAPVPALCVRAANPVDDKRRMAAARYGCEVLWDADDDALCFERSVLLRPLSAAEPKAAAGLLALVEQKLLPHTRLPFRERVARAIEMQLSGGMVSQGSVARGLGMSVRSLQRGLQEEGLRYGDVFGDVLKAVATRLMLDSARSLDAIALELGYSEASSFARSWRRLTGESPARYRARVVRTGGTPETREPTAPVTKLKEEARAASATAASPPNRLSKTA